LVFEIDCFELALSFFKANVLRHGSARMAFMLP
jgi:hypothetical protein